MSDTVTGLGVVGALCICASLSQTKNMDVLSEEMSHGVIRMRFYRLAVSPISRQSNKTIMV